MLILGIETSCDETAVAVVEDGRKILASEVSSQIKFHSKYGGVIPELASRKQIELISPILEEVRRNASFDLDDIDALAVTSNPGLIGSLLVGISTAKAFEYVFNIPLYEIDHVEAHLYANFLYSCDPPVHRIRRAGARRHVFSAVRRSGDITHDVPSVSRVPEMPFIGLVVSGGHTSLFLVKGHKDIETLGKTRDDAAGEAFDKVAKLLGFPYPGGPQIEKLARRGSPDKIEFPRPYLHGSYDFSFSGLKTAVAYYIKDKKPKVKTQRSKVADVAAGFQEAVVQTLVYKAVKTARKEGIKRIVLGGGVTANERLRSLFRSEAEKYDIELFIPPVKFCLDNAAMVACRAYYKNCV
jgi:N6-L-threonylcarbamoyladenine synthase